MYLAPHQHTWPGLWAWQGGTLALLGHLADVLLSHLREPAVPTLALTPVAQPLGLLLFPHHREHSASPGSLRLLFPLAGRLFLPNNPYGSLLPSLPLSLQVFAQVSPC